jgi:hypothetical protein
LINLAQEYYLRSAFKEAVQYYKQAMQWADAVNGSLRAGLVLNFILALMRDTAYHEARQLADEHRDLRSSSSYW